jgi:hypothetical protein
MVYEKKRDEYEPQTEDNGVDMLGNKTLETENNR